ncbi:MAG: ABC transporter ATP-binding protein, partial [Eubacterium sp.]|nr:ABC transporter ATP-binding protein [Eubacterium sp.]
MARHWMPLHEDVKVPVMKNILFAIKICFKADKSLMLSAILAQTSFSVFSLFIQGVLFLKVLLNLIEGGASFEYFIKMLLIFLGVALINEVIIIACDYLQNVGMKKVTKGLNDLIFEKAANVDVSCYEDPEFYDKYQRATEIITHSYFFMFCMDISNLIGSVISFFLVIGIVSSIDPAYLIFLSPVLFIFVFEIVKSKIMYKRNYSMTTNNRIKNYSQRTVFLKDFSKDIRTSNIFSVIINRFRRAVDDNIRIIKNYGWKLFFYTMLSSLFGELIPIVGTYSFASYQFINNSGLDISGFSVVLSSINSVRTTTRQIADSLASLSNVALYFQNLRDFFDYESKVVSGNLEAGEFESIEFKNVSFKYPSAKKYSLKN